MVIARRFAVVAVALASGCSWSQFDDLAATTWVHAQGKPDSVASDFGLAVVAATPSTAQMGGRLVVLGTSATTIDELNFEPKGDSSLLKEIKVAAQFGVVNYPDPPLLLKPRLASRLNEVALVVPSGGNGVVISAQGLDTSSPIGALQQVVGISTVDGATYLAPAGASLEQMLVGSMSTVYGMDLANGNQKACPLVDEANMPVLIAALAAVPIAANDDSVLVWARSGKLHVYSNAVFGGCTAGDAVAKPTGTADTGFTPGSGARIHLVGGSKQVVLAARMGGASGGPNTAASIVVGYDLTSGTPVKLGSAVMKDNLHASAVGTIGTQTFVMLGFPQESVNGTTGGAVFLHPFDTSGGVAATPMLSLARAQPESTDQFGRAVGTMSYNGQTILVVGGNNVVFAYYRSALYPDTRSP